MINALTALLLSLFAPGAGQIYNGHYFKAALMAIIYVMGMSVFYPLCVRFLKLTNIEAMLKTAKACNALVICAVAASVIDAVFSAYFMQGTSNANLIAAVVYVFAAVALFNNLKNSTLISMLAGNTLAADIALNKGDFAPNANKQDQPAP